MCVQDNLMVCGIDVFHDVAKERRSIGGFVASLNKSCTRWYSRVSYQMPGQELIDCLKVCFTAALRKYHEVSDGRWLLTVKGTTGV